MRSITTHNVKCVLVAEGFEHTLSQFSHSKQPCYVNKEKGLKVEKLGSGGTGTLTQDYVCVTPEDAICAVPRVCAVHSLCHCT